MIRRGIFTILGLVSVCIPLHGQQAVPDVSDSVTISTNELRHVGASDTESALSLYRPDLFSAIDGATLIHGLPVLTLLDGRRFPISGPLARMGMSPVDLFPIAFLTGVEVQSVHGSPRFGSDSSGGVVNLRTDRVYTGGEVGVFYGKSSGRYGREDFETHIIGSVGPDKFQLTAGAAYQESSGRVPRSVR